MEIGEIFCDITSSVVDQFFFLKNGKKRLVLSRQKSGRPILLKTKRTADFFEKQFTWVGVSVKSSVWGIFRNSRSQNAGTTRGLHQNCLMYVLHSRCSRVFPQSLVGLVFLQSVSYKKTIPTHEKIFAEGESGPNATFNLFFFWVGLALAKGVRRFHNNIYMVFQPNRIS